MPDLRHPGRPAILLAIGAVILVAMIGGGLLVARHLDREADLTAPTPTPTAGACSLPTESPGPATPDPANWMRHVDRQTGFSIDYPGAWNVYDPPRGTQFAAGPDSQNNVEVRVLDLGTASIGPNDTTSQKQVVDQALSGLPIRIITRQQVTFAGLNGLQYIYAFTDHGCVGVHVHVFLFAGNKVHTIIFQALPEANLDKLAKTFDLILAAYKLTAAPAGSASPAPTPAPTATP